LKSIKKEVTQKEEKIKELKEKRDKLKEERKHFKAHNLGHVKYEEPEIDIQLSEEISGNLRNLKAQGDILKDRYKSFQKRNILEPRNRAKYDYLKSFFWTI
jgi:nucleolar protein 53